MGAASILTALAVLGGDTLTDFALAPLAPLVGLAVGTYSSMFTATPPVIEVHERRTQASVGSVAGVDQATGSNRTQHRPGLGASRAAYPLSPSPPRTPRSRCRFMPQTVCVYSRARE